MAVYKNDNHTVIGQVKETGWAGKLVRVYFRDILFVGEKYH
jgi:hypothetical protein